LSTGTLTFFCGKMGAGKSTMALQIADELNAVLLSEDAWLEALYPGAIASLEDYVRYSTLLKAPIKQLVLSVLATGTHVVMDFPANTPSQRAWFRGVFTEAEATHRLIYLDVSNDTCLKQIEQRRKEQPERAKTDTPAMFEQVTRFFVAPAKEEGFNIEHPQHKAETP